MGGGGIEIGDRTMIATHTVLTSLGHDPDSTSMHTTLASAPIRLANDVWIGANAIVLPGVTIGEQAVVAAGAVVCSDVPPYSIVAGVPARVVRMKKTPQEKPISFDSHGVTPPGGQSG